MVPAGSFAARTGAHPLRVISSSHPDRSTGSSDELYNSMNCSLPRLISLMLTAAALRILNDVDSDPPSHSAIAFAKPVSSLSGMVILNTALTPSPGWMLS